MKNCMRHFLALILALLMLASPSLSAAAGKQEGQLPDKQSYDAKPETVNSFSFTPESIKITGPKNVAKGKKITLKAVVSPSGASQEVKWSSSDKKIATVSSGGVVTGKKAGTVKITAVSKKNKKVKKTFTVKVKAQAVKKVTITAPRTTVDLAGAQTATVKLKASASPAAAAQDFEWKSSSKAVATVNSKGVVKVLRTGTVKITATATDGSKKKASVTIEVVDSTQKVRIDRQPESANVPMNDTAVFRVEASGSRLSYQWWCIPKGASDWVQCSGSGAQTDTFRVAATADTDGNQYCCMVSDMFGNYEQSDTAVLTVVSPLTIVSQPQHVSADDGSIVSFYFGVSGTGLSYQWYSAMPGDSEWTPVADGTSDTLSFTMTEDKDGMNVYCMASDLMSNYVNSDVAVVSLNLIPDITITQQPGNATAYAGDQAVFRIKASGSKLSYYWYHMLPGDAGWTLYPDAHSDTLAVPVREQDNGMYVVCMITNPLGKTVQSDAVTLSVPVKPVFRALLIANGAYSAANQLPSTYTDAKAIKYALENALRHPYSVTYRTDCTASQILSAIGSAYAGAKDTDVSLFFFDGHGGETEHNTDPWCGSLGCPDGSFVTPAELAQALGAVPGKVIVIVSACHSGALIGKGTAEPSAGGPSAFNKAFIQPFRKYKLSGIQSNYGELANNKFIVLTACHSSETSVSYSEGSGSSFPWAIVNALGCTWPGTAYGGSSPADRDGNKVLTLGECWSYVSVRAKEIIPHEQNAQYYGDNGYPMFILK